jgi:shikimate dehydrogenase
MKIDQKTALFGVMGSPIGHSLSPIMHNAAFRAEKINAVYLAFDSTDVEGCLAGMRALGMMGMSVTIPHKSTVLLLIDEVDSLAEKIGAVNTIVNRGGRLIGYNTDALGALNALNEHTDLTGKSCFIIGAGGAARAIGFILKDRGVKISIANRSAERGEALAGALDCPFFLPDQLSEMTADIVIQTTPVGMFPKTDQCPLPDSFLKRGMVVMDIIYNPLKTKLLSLADKQGCLTINGLGMFIQQGAEQFRLWTGRKPPVAVMTEAVRESLSDHAS